MSITPTPPSSAPTPATPPASNPVPPAVDRDHDGDNDAAKPRATTPPGVGRVVDKDV